MARSLFATMLDELRESAAVLETAPDAARAARGQVDEAGRAALGALRAAITGRKGEDAVTRELARLGVAALHDVVLPDGRGGLTQVDHIARAPGVIVAVETKTYSGVIHGTLAGVGWVQHVGEAGRGHAVPNAVRQNARHCAAVSALLLRAGAAVPVRGLVVSAGTAVFAGELAGAVVQLGALGTELVVLAAAAVAEEAALDAAWWVLSDAAVRGEALREEHAAGGARVLLCCSCGRGAGPPRRPATGRGRVAPAAGHLGPADGATLPRL